MTTALPALTEAKFQEYVMELAALGGWKCMHIANSRRIVRRAGRADAVIGDKLTRGWPDLLLAHPRSGIVIAELKTEKGKPTPSQHEWLDALVAAGGVHVALWRPADCPTIERVLLNHDLSTARWWARLS